MQEELMRQNGNSEDFIIEAMKRDGIEVNRQNYLDFIFPDGIPEDYGAELEAEMPEQLREK